VSRQGWHHGPAATTVKKAKGRRCGKKVTSKQKIGSKEPSAASTVEARGGDGTGKEKGLNGQKSEGHGGGTDTSRNSIGGQ